jgi:hypothetical protein
MTPADRLVLPLPETAGGHQAPQPDSRPNAVAPARKQNDTVMLTDGRVTHRDASGHGHRGGGVVFVAVLVPSKRRRLLWYLAICCACGAPHLGRARDAGSVAGPRRLPCGHQVTIAAGVTYGDPEPGA